jgi:hypothetical protein
MNGGTDEKSEKENEITIFNILLEFREINCEICAFLICDSTIR